jgi:hypothetical protein
VVAWDVREMSDPVLIALIAAAGAISSAVISGVIGTLLGSYLQRRGREHAIRYERLHEQRAEVMAHLHASLFDLNEVRRYYVQHSLWLDEEISEKLDAFLKKIYDICDEFSVVGWALGLAGFEEAGNREERKSRQEAYEEEFGGQFPSRGWLRLDDRVRGEVPQLRQVLRSEFREIVGVANLPARRSSRSWWRRLFSGG